MNPDDQNVPGAQPGTPPQEPGLGGDPGGMGAPTTPPTVPGGDAPQQPPAPEPPAVPGGDTGAPEEQQPGGMPPAGTPPQPPAGV